MVTFELSHGQQHGENQAAARGCGVEPELEYTKTHAPSFELIDEFQHTADVSAQSIKAHDRDDVSPTHPRECRLKLRAVHPCTRDAVIDEELAATGLSERIKLTLDGLPGRGDSGVPDKNGR